MALSPSAHPSSIARHDLPLAIVVTVLLLIGTGVSLEDDWVIAIAGAGHRVWLPAPGGLTLVLGSGLVLAFRHLAPVTGFAVNAGASLAYQALGYRPQPPDPFGSSGRCVPAPRRCRLACSSRCSPWRSSAVPWSATRWPRPTSS